MARTTKKSSTTSKSGTKSTVKLAVVGATEDKMDDQTPTDAPASETVAMAEGAALLVKKKDFVERVVAVSGAKKAVARDLTEAVLQVLGEALSKGEGLILPPLGKLRVAKSMDKSGAEVLQIKLKRPGPESASKKAEKTAEDPLAEPQE
mgnify:CR=1 FL=1